MVVVVLLVLVSVLIGLLCLFMGATTRLSYLCSGRPLRWSELLGVVWVWSWLGAFC